MEFFSDQSGGWFFSKYTLTRLYWLVYMAYLVFSTSIAGCVHLVYRIKKRRFTRLAVMLSHVIPVALVWISLSFGIYDFIQDNSNRRTSSEGDNLSENTSKNPKQSPPIPQTPLSKPLPEQPKDAQVQESKPMTTQDDGATE